jgi:hypothetical protein
MQSYSIDDVPLIPQTKNMACWYASAQMLIAWRQARKLMCEGAHPDPSLVPSLRAKFLDNDGIPASVFRELAMALGLKEMPPMTPSPGMIASMLKEYGPLWFAGLHPFGHVVVITGVSPSSLAINDPAPVNVGARRTITLYRFGEILQPAETRQGSGFAGGDLAANILHFPG